MTRRTKYRLTCAVGLLVALACNEHGVVPLDQAIQVEVIDISSQAETNMIDILWIIDNSNSMCEEQESLTENFATFIDGLTEINADFHLAVATTDMQPDHGYSGRFQTAPGDPGMACADSAPLNCPASTGPVLSVTSYLEDANDITSTIDVTRLQQDFECIARVGVGGSGFEKGLDAMLAALSPELRDTTNNGFRRESAWLAIIFVADENDCSDGNALELTSAYDCEWLREDLTSIEYFFDEILEVDGEGTDIGERLLVAGIIGPDDGQRPTVGQQLSPSCNSDRGEAYPCYRYEAFIDSFEDRGVVSDICRDSFQTALDQIASVIRANLSIRCLRHSPVTCEDDFDCSGSATCLTNLGEPGGIQVCSDFTLVVELREPGSSQWRVLDGPGTETPEYLIDFDANTCTTGVGIEFTEGNEPAPGSAFRLRYQIQLSPDTTAAADAGGD